MVTLKHEVKKYNSLGRCIFCLSKEPDISLTEEHIIPFFLSGSGELLIEKGSCKKCNSFANENYEQEASKTDLYVPRLLLELKRRKKSNAKALPPVALGPVRQASLEKYDTTLTVEEHPKLITLCVFGVAGKFLGEDKGGDLKSLRLAHMNFESKSNAFPSLGISTRHSFNHSAFTKTIAKMAYTYAVANLGLDSFDGAEIRQLLNGERSDVFNFVGDLHQTQNYAQDRLHGLYIKKKNGILSVVVHLFACCKAPPYEVYLGPLK